MSTSPLSSLRAPPAPEAPKESAVARLLIAPLTFISFLISLALIDTHNHSLRAHSHSTPRPPPTTIYGRFKASIHLILYKPVPPNSPYGYVRSPGEKERGVGAKGGDAVAGKEGEEPWHWNTKQRKMMKAEVSDAFRIRKRVMVIMGVLLAVAGVGSFVLGSWALVVVWDWVERGRWL